LENKKDYGTVMLGCIGKDNYGNRIYESLEKLNVKTILERSETDLSSRCAVGIFKKERTLVPQIRASNKLSLEFVKANIVKFYFLIKECYFSI
jgi:sugar/nucleoside kinase (ribokinase family)